MKAVQSSWMPGSLRVRVRGRGCFSERELWAQHYTGRRAGAGGAPGRLALSEHQVRGAEWQGHWGRPQKMEDSSSVQGNAWRKPLKAWQCARSGCGLLLLQSFWLVMSFMKHQTRFSLA